MHGLSCKVTKAGLPVLRCHYSADPEKRPGTPVGDAWLEHATAGYPGGTASPRWRKEMEIDYGALGGTKLFPHWQTWKQNGRIVIPPFDPIGYKLYGSYDHGWRHKACYLVHGIDSDGRFVTLWECWASHVHYQALAAIINGKSQRVRGGCCPAHPHDRHFPGNPFAGQELFKVADPSIWSQDQQQSDNTMKSMYKLFKQEGVHFIPGQRGGDTTVAEWFMGHWWANPEEPLWRITSACPGLIWEIGEQRHKDISEKVALNKSKPEELVDKNNDAYDALKVFALRFPPKSWEPHPEEKPNTFAWWRKMALAARHGEPVPTFVRTVE